MKFNRLMALIVLLASGLVFAVSPQRLKLTNQYGEQSLSYVNGTYLPLPPSSSSATTQVVVFTGTTITPTSATGLNVAGTGSLYIGRNPASYNSSRLWINYGTITAPAWSKVGP